MEIELTTKQIRDIKSIVKSECANHADGKCVPMEMPCPQLTAEGGLCKYFKECVLPLNPELEHELIGTGYNKTCKRCGKGFVTKRYNDLYCDFCTGVMRKESQREYARKKRQGGK